MDYVPLRIKTVKPNEELTFDLYIYYKDHYLCYAEKGNILSPDKLEKLIHQKMADFFIPKDQIDNVTTFLDKALNEALCGENISTEERVDTVSEIAANTIERMGEEPNETNYKLTQRAAYGLRAVIKENPQALKKLFGKKSDESDHIINHSINVCGFATRLAEHLKFKDDEINNIATAALMHDIGLTQMPVEDLELFEKEFIDMSPSEKLRYGKHPRSSKDLLSGKEFISKEVEDLIVNHEEDLTGEGPMKMSKLTPAQECLSLCNAFDKRLYSKKETPAEAYKVFQLDYIGRYNLELIQRLENVLKDEGLL